MIKKNKLKVLADIIILLLTLALIYFLVGKMIKSVISVKQPFIANTGQLESDTNTYMLKPCGPKSLNR